MSTIRTSGIIAAFNQEHYIVDAISSLANQVDEMIVIDDCSTDGTMNAINSLNFSNLTLLRNHKNSGVSYSLNKAIGSSSGQVLVLSGGDDISLPGRVARQASALLGSDTLNLGFVYSKPEIIDENGSLIPQIKASEFLFTPSEKGVLSDLVFTGNFICAPSVAMRREAFLATGGFHPDLLYTQDHDLWVRILGAGFTAQELKDHDVRYRKHARNLSRYVSRRSSEQRNLRQLAEADFVIHDFLATTSDQTLRTLAAAWGVDSQNLERFELEILVSFFGSNLFASRHGLRSFFRHGRVGHSGILQRISVDEMSTRADVLSVLEQRHSTD